MRALFVAPYLPTPGSGGRTRLVNLMERLAREHDLRIAAFCARDQSAAENSYPGIALAPPEPKSRPGGIRGRVRFYGEKLQPLPAFVDWMFTPAMVGAIAEECARFRPHIVHVETTEMAQYLRGLPRGPAKALDMQDVASRWFGRVAELGDTRQERALMRIEHVKTRRYEKNAARDADVVFVSSPVDGAFYAELTGVKPVEVPNGVDTDAFAPMSGAAEDQSVILFVGPLTYDANLDGMRWFAREVLPLILKEEPSARVDLVGTAIDDHGFPEQVRLLGRVEDVRPHLARAPVSVVPVRIGTGTRYKILEALSMARAVVSTTIGAEGLGIRDGEHLLIADTPEDFATAVVKALRDPALRARLGDAGRKYVVPRYDWEPLVARVSEAWDRVASTRYE